MDLGTLRSGDWQSASDVASELPASLTRRDLIPRLRIPKAQAASDSEEYIGLNFGLNGPAAKSLAHEHFSSPVE